MKHNKQNIIETDLTGKNEIQTNIKLTESEFKIFLNKLKHPPTPSENLIQAKNNYHKIISQD